MKLLNGLKLAVLCFAIAVATGAACGAGLTHLGLQFGSIAGWVATVVAIYIGVPSTLLIGCWLLGGRQSMPAIWNRSAPVTPLPLFRAFIAQTMGYLAFASVFAGAYWVR